MGGVGVTSVRTGGSGPSGERRDGRLSSVSGFSSGGFTACSKATELHSGFSFGFYRWVQSYNNVSYTTTEKVNENQMVPLNVRDNHVSIKGLRYE